MKWQALVAALMAGTVAIFVGCAQTPVPNVAVPAADDPSAYRPVPAPKPLPPNGYVPGGLPPAMPYPGQPGQAGMTPAPGGGLTVSPNPSIENEDAFVAAYAKRSPRIMVFVNRTIQGDPLPKDGLDEVLRVEKTQSATGAVAVNNTNTTNGMGQSTAAGFGGSSASNNNYNTNNSTSFTSGGPATYTNTTSVKKPTDKYDIFGATSDDYDMIEASIVSYFNNSGKVTVQDSEAARAKLDREQILRIENADPAANRLLATELQADVLIRVTAKPTTQSGGGPAIRLIAKAVSTTDARNLGTEFVDMPLPMSKPNINVFTRYLSGKLMGDMAVKWSLPAEYDPVEVRIYKAASIDDSLKIKDWLAKTPGVKSIKTNSATGGASTSYASYAVGYAGAPEDLYKDLKDGIGLSTGLKAVDLSNTTINLEITGPMNLVTTTRHVESTTTIETRTTEEQRITPVNPAPPQN